MNQKLYQVQVLSDEGPSIKPLDMRWYFSMEQVNQFIERRVKEKTKEEIEDGVMSFIVSIL